jgi:hypothetical protein
VNPSSAQIDVGGGSDRLRGPAGLLVREASATVRRRIDRLLGPRVRLDVNSLDTGWLRLSAVATMRAPKLAYSWLWLVAGNRKTEFQKALAGQYSRSARTLQRWNLHFRRGGVSALCPGVRRDRGRPRKVTAATLLFVMDNELSRRGQRLSTRRVFETYRESLGQGADLPVLSYETLGFWRRRVRELLATIARLRRDEREAACALWVQALTSSNVDGAP